MTTIPTLAIAQDNLRAAETALNTFKKDLFAKREEAWLAAGGCTSCNGSGIVCVWGTLDSMTGGYDEFGACEKCGGKVNTYVGSNKNRKSQHPHVDVPDLCQTDDEKNTEKALKGAVRDAKDMFGLAEKSMRVIIGSEVTVIGGRKAPKGTQGKVFWMGEGRLGMKNAEGKVFWITSTTHVEVVTQRTMADLKAEEAAYNNANKLRWNVSRGTQVVSDAVTGSVAWAGNTKRGDGPWRALVKRDGKDFWLSAADIQKVNGKDVAELSY